MWKIPAWCSRFSKSYFKVRAALVVQLKEWIYKSRELNRGNKLYEY